MGFSSMAHKESVADGVGSSAHSILHCVFCMRQLSDADLKTFRAKRLNILHKDNILLGACHTCCCRVAAKEILLADICLEGDGVTLFEGKSLDKVPVTCAGCLGFLSDLEKLCCVLGNHPFYRVRRRWRNYCKFCVQ